MRKIPIEKYKYTAAVNEEEALRQRVKDMDIKNEREREGIDL